MKTIMWFGFVLGALSAAGKVFLTKPGLSALLECEVGSFTNLAWWRAGNRIVSILGKSGFVTKGSGDIAGRSVLRSERNLEVLKVKKEDAGTFTCMVDGKTHTHTLLVVSVSASPPGGLQLGSEAKLQCQVEGLDAGSTVQWMRPNGSPHAESHTVQIQSVAPSDAGTWECTFSHGGDKYKQGLIITVEEPAPITLAPVTTQGPKVIAPPDGGPGSTALLSWWVWVAVGVGFLVVVLLLVSVIVLCKRIRRRKRKLRKIQYDRQLLNSKQYCQCNRPAAAARPKQGRRREKPSALPLTPLLME